MGPTACFPRQERLAKKYTPLTLVVFPIRQPRLVNTNTRQFRLDGEEVRLSAAEPSSMTPQILRRKLKNEEKFLGAERPAAGLQPVATADRARRVDARPPADAPRIVYDKHDGLLKQLPALHVDRQDKVRALLDAVGGRLAYSESVDLEIS
jgi:hypothetical protein